MHSCNIQNVHANSSRDFSDSSQTTCSIDFKTSLKKNTTGIPKGSVVRGLFFLLSLSDMETAVHPDWNRNMMFAVHICENKQEI